MAPSTDLIERLTIATVAIMNASTRVRAVTGRTTLNCLALEDGAVNRTLPCVFFYVVSVTDMIGILDSRRVRLGFKMLASGNDARRKVSDLMEAVDKDLTNSAYTAQGMDVAPRDRIRYGTFAAQGTGSADAGGARNIVEADQEIELLITG